MQKLTDAEKAEEAIELLQDLASCIKDVAGTIRCSEARQYDADGSLLTVDQTRFATAMYWVNHIQQLIDTGPTANWFENYYRLTGEHMVLSEEGWMPASMNTVEATGEEPMEVLKEVNVPGN